MAFTVNGPCCCGRNASQKTPLVFLLQTWNIRLLLSCLNVLNYILPNSSNLPKGIEVYIKLRDLWVWWGFFAFLLLFFHYCLNKQAVKAIEKTLCTMRGSQWVIKSLSSNYRWRCRDGGGHQKSLSDFVWEIIQSHMQSQFLRGGEHCIPCWILHITAEIQTVKACSQSRQQSLRSSRIYLILLFFSEMLVPFGRGMVGFSESMGTCPFNW